MRTAAPSVVLFSALFACAWSWAHAMVTCGQEVLKEDFNGYPGEYQTWTEQLMRSDFPDALPTSRGFDRAKVGHGNLQLIHPKGVQRLRNVHYGAGRYDSCVSGRECGVVFAARLAKPVKAATLSYRVKFEEGFDWTKGGKMPGLCDDDCPMGCTQVGHDDGFSTRLMWRDGGQLVSYVYYPQHQQEHDVRCGADWQWGKQAQSGRWYQFSLYMKVNSPGERNGVQRVWMDGKEVLSRTDVLYRNSAKHVISRFIFQNFHGGSDSRFAPDHTQHMWFDDIVVHEGECPGNPGSHSSQSYDTTPSTEDEEESGGSEELGVFLFEFPDSDSSQSDDASPSPSTEGQRGGSDPSEEESDAHSPGSPDSHSSQSPDLPLRADHSSEDGREPGASGEQGGDAHPPDDHASPAADITSEPEPVASEGATTSSDDAADDDMPNDTPPTTEPASSMERKGSDSGGEEHESSAQEGSNSGREAREGSDRTRRSRRERGSRNRDGREGTQQGRRLLTGS